MRGIECEKTGPGSAGVLPGFSKNDLRGSTRGPIVKGKPR